MICLICKSYNLKPFYSQDRVPVCMAPIEHNLIGKLDIVMCRNCSMIFNRSFDKNLIRSIYKEEYSASLPVSKKNIERMKGIASDVILRKNISGRHACEIGASDFSFSKVLLEHGAKDVIAVEPSRAFDNTDERIMHIREYITKEIISKYVNKCNLVVMRHVLEHLSDPFDLLKDLSEALDLGSIIYIEVPNIVDILDKKRNYDFIYEHVSYFNMDLLRQILIYLGFEVLNEAELVFGQHIGIVGRKVKDLGDFDIFNNKRMDFNLDLFQKSVFKFDQEILKILSENNSVAIYGAGAQAVSISSRLNLSGKDVVCMLDLNPVKDGKMSPLCNIPIMLPTVRCLSNIKTIIIMASLHQDEIYDDLRNKWNFEGRIFGTYPDVRELD